MFSDNKIWIGKSENRVYLEPKMANRHGLVAGATGTGKTITLKVLAESFSEMGVPVFLADIKGDLASLATAGTDSENMQERIKRFEIDNFSYKSFPVQFWDLFGEGGLPVRTTVSEMGPLLLSRILNLNDTQTGIMNIIFRIADDKGLLLLDLKDLRAMVQYVGDNAKEYTLDYGNISSQSIGAILRNMIALEDQGGEYFFGEPELDFNDWMKVDSQNKGYINILHSPRLFLNPSLYSTFLLWMLSELFENLPEEGDLEKPKMVFFFDEAHLLFEDAPKILLDKIEQVVRLIRSKGVGVYFITQSPTDLPDDVLSQLGNRIQHALRAYTPAERKKVIAAAETFRQNQKFNTVEAITELATGEALISMLDEKGRPSVVERAFVLPPQSKFGTIDDLLRNQIIKGSKLYSKYSEEVDRKSAFEVIREEKRIQQEYIDSEKERIEKQKIREQKEKEEKKYQKNIKKSNRMTPTEKAANSAMSAIGREIGKSLIRGILGSLKR
ncbi:helicase HerA-like domain-containing protein [Sedimentibacter saalensis]|uniref:helicase HerA-like domain-containing protein n=1 Tax=Sedimentibacter saalensis TaxID=130788 RepID=UPI0028A1088E|nr:helicase HerA-like domain-containing protein [Sedimentibacter saalensis]